jgi:hypothetical protein
VAGGFLDLVDFAALVHKVTSDTNGTVSQLDRGCA